jgi:glycosyltransferase involved in cell wall biosynthesis
MQEKSQIKIVEIVRSAQYGGVETHVYDLLQHGIKYGYDMKLISLTNVPPNESFQRLGVEIILLPDSQWMSGSLMTNINRSISNAYKLYETLKHMQPDIVHLHGTRPIFIGSIAAKCARINNIISTVHNSYQLMAITCNGDIDKRLRLLSKIICFVGVMLAKRILTISDAIKAEIVELMGKVFLGNYINNKTITMYLGVTASNYDNSNLDIRKCYDIKESTKIIGTVTRLDEPKKGLSILLKATRILKDRGCDIKVLIAGDGSSRQSLNKLTNDLGLNSDVIFLGYCDKTHELYSNFNIFVLPSLSEGLGIVNLEAMAASLPVVASRVGGIPEAIRHHKNGILVTPNSVNELADAIYYLIMNQVDAIKMGKTGRDIVVREFDKKTSLTKIFNEYTAILKQ